MYSQITTLEQINNTNPGSEKKFCLKYKLVEERWVTVTAKTYQEAYLKATKEVDRRILNRLVNGFRYDSIFTISSIVFLISGYKTFKKARNDINSKSTSREYRGMILDGVSIDINAKSA